MKPPALNPQAKPRPPLMRRAAPDALGQWVFVAVVTTLLLQFFAIIAMEVA